MTGVGVFANPISRTNNSPNLKVDLYCSDLPTAESCPVDSKQLPMIAWQTEEIISVGGVYVYY